MKRAAETLTGTRRLRILAYGDIGGSGGYVRYCRGIFGSGGIPADMDVTFVCSTGFYEKLKPLDAGVRIVTHPWPASPSRLRRYLWHLWVYPKLVRRVAPDIEFYPSGQLRVFLRRAATVATCHNLLLFDPEEMRRIEGSPDYHFFANYRRTQARSLERATGVIFPSEHSRMVVERELPGIERSRIVPHGLDPEFLFETERSYAIGRRVDLLYASSIFPYKHHAEVIRAVKAIRDATGLDVRLRLVGSASPAASSQLVEVVRSENSQDHVEIVGEVTRDALIREYRRADLFLFASSSETFGITLLEAMGARLPIACADRTGLPDILRNAGVYFNPELPASIADAVSQLLVSDTQRQTLGERAHRYASEYTWERSAHQTFAFIRDVYVSAVRGTNVRG